MKKFYILTILFTLLGLGQAWAETAKISNRQWDGNRSWSGNHVTFTLNGEGTSYYGGALEANAYLTIAGGTEYTITWNVDECHDINVTSLGMRIGFNGWLTGKCDINVNGVLKETIGTTTGSEKNYSGYSLGNSDHFTLKTSKDVNIYWLEITYTMGSNSYSMVFHAPDATSGEMANQVYYYDEAQNLTANAFARAYTVNYDADGGECAETSAVANYAFDGWATEPEGEAVYTDGQNLNNLTKVDGAVIDLYATWKSASVTLPTATKESFLFDGWYSGETYVGKAGDVITPVADTSLVAHWVDKLTPQFSLEATEIELGQTALLTLTNVENPTVQIAPEGIVEYNAETGLLTAVGLGEATITITQEEKATIAAKQEILKLKVGKKTPTIEILLAEVAQNSIELNPGKTATVSFNKVSEAEVAVALVSGDEFASYNEGVVTAISEGVAVFSVTQAETDVYKPLYAEFRVIVMLAGEVNECYLINDNELSEWSTISNSKTYEFNEKVPGAILTFEARRVALAGFSNSSNFYAQTSANGSDWDDLFKMDLAKTDTWYSYKHEMPENARYVRFATKTGATGYKSIQNVKVTRKTYLKAENVALEAKAGQECAGAIKVAYSIANGGDLQITCNNDKFVLSSKLIEAADCKGGEAVIDVTYPSNKLVEDEAQVVIFNSVYRKVIKLTAVITANPDAPAAYSEDTVSICDGDSIEYKGVWYKTATGEEPVPVLVDEKNELGGDSIIKLTVIVLEPTFGEEQKAITVGAEEEWHGVALKDYAVGKYEWNDTLVNAVGCDSVVALTLIVNKIETLEIPVKLMFCDGDSAQFRGKWYKTAASEEFPYAGDTRDTLYIVTAVVLQPSFGEEQKAITVGTEEEWHGVALKDYAVGKYEWNDTLVNAVGCDSVVALTLTVSKIETLNVPVALSFCEGGSETYRGVVYTEAGKYEIPAVGATRDTLFVVNVTVLQPSASADEKTIVLGEAGTWNGYDLSTYGIGAHNLVYKTVNAAGCDSTVTLTLTVVGMDALEVPEQISFCAGDKKTYRGREFEEAGVFNIYAKGETRDTVYVVTVTLLQPSFSNENKAITVGAEESWKGHDLSGYAVGVFELKDTTVNAAGCDSVIVLTLTVNKMETLNVPVEMSFCQGGSVEYRGTEYTAAGEYKIPATGETRDTLYVLTVTELLPTASAEEKTIVLGKQETWNGYDLSEYAEGEHKLVYKTVNVAGCDSTVTLTLTVVGEKKTYGEYKAVICGEEGIEFNGDTYTTAVTAKEVLMKEKNIYGGDSIVLLTITVGQATPTKTEYKAISYGDKETWNGHDLSTYEVGQHWIVDEYKNITGCDSIVRLKLTVERAELVELEQRISFCEGDSAEYLGKWYYKAVVDPIEIEGEGGDTIIYVIVTVNKHVATQVEKEIEAGTEEAWGGYDLSTYEAGIYELVDSLQTEAGCDSVVTLILTVKEKIMTGMDEVEQHIQAQKYYRNGVIYIRRGDNIYMLDGKKVE